MSLRKFFLRPAIRSLFCATTCLLSVVLAVPALAQTAPKQVLHNDTVRSAGKVYTYVEQMPQLPGGGGNASIVGAIQRNLAYPLEALKRHVTGQVFVSFTVSETGLVHDIQIVKGIGGGCDESVLAAVQQLPQFTPGRQAGIPVPVRFTVPVTFQIGAPATKVSNGEHKPATH